MNNSKRRVAKRQRGSKRRVSKRHVSRRRVSRRRVSKRRVSKRRVSKRRSVSKRRVSKRRSGVKRRSVVKRRVSKRRVSKKLKNKRRILKKKGGGGENCRDFFLGFRNDTGLITRYLLSKGPDDNTYIGKLRDHCKITTDNLVQRAQRKWRERAEANKKAAAVKKAEAEAAAAAKKAEEEAAKEAAEEAAKEAAAAKKAEEEAEEEAAKEAAEAEAKADWDQGEGRIMREDFEQWRAGEELVEKEAAAKVDAEAPKKKAEREAAEEAGYSHLPSSASEASTDWPVKRSVVTKKKEETNKLLKNVHIKPLEAAKKKAERGSAGMTEAEFDSEFQTIEAKKKADAAAVKKAAALSNTIYWAPQASERGRATSHIHLAPN